MIRRLFSALLALVIALGLAACRPEPVDPTPTPTPTPSPVVTPSPTVDGYAELYEEAKQVYLRSVELSKPFEMLGEFNGFPAELEELLADPYLDLTRKTYELFEQRGIHALPGPEPVYTFAEYRGVARDGSEIAIRVCHDTRGITAVDATGAVVPTSELGLMVLYFKHVDGRLKLFYSDVTEVDACPFS